MDFNENLALLAENLEWNIYNREVICSSEDYIESEVILALLRLLEFNNNDDVVRETIYCIHELYDETSIFYGIEEIDECDVKIRAGLMGFL